MRLQTYLQPNVILRLIATYLFPPPSGEAGRYTRMKIEIENQYRAARIMEFKRNHQETYFYKYVSSSTAKRILENGSFLIRCPLEFNDPFDVQIGMHFDFDIDNLPEIFFEKLDALVKAENQPIFENENDISTFVLRIRELKKSHGFPKEKLRMEMQQHIATMGASFESARILFVQERMKLVKRMRVLCLSETFENVLMWSHYADNHAGIVFRLKVAETEAEDDPLWIAEKVTYTGQAIPLMTQDEALDEIFGIKKYDVTKLTRQLTCTKFDVWDHEKEWRIWDVVDEGNKSDYYITLNFRRFEAIYFGCKTEESVITEIKAIARSKNNEMKFYKANKHESEYKLEFIPI